jgi:hypothetical protein
MSQLLTKFKALENSRQQLQSQLSKKNSEELYYKSSPESWSMIQATLHMMTTEKLAIDYISKKVKGINTSPKTGLKASFSFFLLKISLKSSLKFKAPKALPEPLNNETVENIISQWNASRALLEEILKNFPAQHENKEVFKNIVVGKLNIHQALGWMEDHFNHHLLQINRVSIAYNTKN